MMLQQILIAAGVVAGIGLIIGLLLGFAADQFAVEVDEREAAVREALPGNNCGGCGYAGCDGLAKAIAEGKAPADACPVGGAPVAANVAKIMGVEVQSGPRTAAFVHCAGTCSFVGKKYDYYGVQDCQSAGVVPGAGDKACSFGCLGYGSCVKACPFDAIHVVNGIAVVDQEACKACGKCVAACPKHLISILPVEKDFRIACSNTDKGPSVKKTCMVGCIGCGLCAKMCPSQAITMENNIPVFHYDKCTNCGTCALKCPSHAITMTPEVANQRAEEEAKRAYAAAEAKKKAEALKAQKAAAAQNAGK